jgi:hypothetical protein
MSSSIAHPQDHADQDHIDPHQPRYVGAAQMVHSGWLAAGAGIPAARGLRPHGAVQGEESAGPLAVVDELDAAVAVLEPEKVRLRVEPVDAG